MPEVESDGAAQPIGAMPQAAAINQAITATAGITLRIVLIGVSLMVAAALFGLYFYRRRQADKPAT
jgi:hypothetical protein